MLLNRKFISDSKMMVAIEPIRSQNYRALSRNICTIELDPQPHICYIYKLCCGTSLTVHMLHDNQLILEWE